MIIARRCDWERVVQSGIPKAKCISDKDVAVADPGDVVRRMARRERKGDIAPTEMYRTFNMGLGMVIAVAAGDEARALEVLKQAGETAQIIGCVAAGKGVTHAALE